MSGKTARLDVGIWWNEKTGHIHIAAHDHFISTVNDVAGSKRCHQNLYMKLARSLRDTGKPHPPISE